MLSQKLKTGTLFLLVGLGLLVGSPALAGGDKVVLCHVPDGNPANAQEISISESAADAHLSHHQGDTLGPCTEPEPEEVACPCFDAVTLEDYSTCVITPAFQPLSGRRTSATAPGLTSVAVFEGVPNTCAIGDDLLGPISADEAAACADLILDELGPACFGVGGGS